MRHTISRQSARLCTVNGAWPELGVAIKFAVTGAGAFVTMMEWLALLVWPLPPLTVNVAVKLPAAL